VTVASISCAGARCSPAPRDHSHVENLVRKGQITKAQAQTHPLRNFVECWGAPALPQMTLRRLPVHPQDVLLVCTDGWWSGLAEGEISIGLAVPGRLGDGLTALAQLATRRNGLTSDNASAAAVAGGLKPDDAWR
jgi:serine/threonine protein phosphatase PrpC